MATKLHLPPELHVQIITELISSCFSEVASFYYRHLHPKNDGAKRGPPAYDFDRGILTPYQDAFVRLASVSRPFLDTTFRLLEQHYDMMARRTKVIPRAVECGLRSPYWGWWYMRNDDMLMWIMCDMTYRVRRWMRRVKAAAEGKGGLEETGEMRAAWHEGCC